MAPLSNTVSTCGPPAAQRDRDPAGWWLGYAAASWPPGRREAQHVGRVGRQSARLQMHARSG